ncbi:unnamed protein product [Owenia fusiformis]|uniref:Uncharacterized protein n=1 Tax=Owenia fusiformis TaxID=6347 RepID=A0A8J1U3T0_OWEFU|nr:unnamed protein product [Owenia fusiformis]
MHRSYQSILPTHNKLLQQKWDDTYYNEHKKKVKEARSMVDTKAPRTYLHLHLKPKKLQLEEERLATIERDNRILLEKMAYIMRTRGRVDNWNNYEYKSLNREKRQRELLRVTRENQAILQRITMRKPELSAEEDHKNWLQNLQFMDNISQYPKNWWKNDKDDKETSRSAHSRTKSENEAAEENEQQENDETRDSDENNKDNEKQEDKTDSDEQKDNEEQKVDDDKDEEIEQKETETA